MEKDSNSPFIFFVTYDEKLSKSFYVFDRAFKDLGFILVPVKVDQLQSLLASSDQTQIIAITSVTDSHEMKLYNQKVRPFLKYVLNSKRLSFVLLSSFSKISDVKKYTLQKNYFFMKYPLDAFELSAKISRYYKTKSETNIRWPGGRRAGMSGVA